MNRARWSGQPLICCTFLIISCGGDAATGPAQELLSSAAVSGTWTTKAPMPTPRTHLAAGVAAVAGQQLFYAIGGFDPSSGPVTAVEAYDFGTNSWSTRAPLPVALTLTNGTGTIGGKIYLSGGVLDGSGRQSSLYVYDPNLNSWQRMADMPKRTAQGVTGVIGGKLYVLVGSCQDCASPTPRRLFRYDPGTDKWTGALPSSPNVHVGGAGGVINGKFYVAGGRDRIGRDSNKLDVYDPVSNTWATLEPMPTARSGATAAVLGGKLYVIGQGNVEPGKHQNQVEAYDPVRNRWNTRASLPGVGRGDLAAGRIAFEGRGVILAVGGTDVEGSGPGDVNQAYIP